LWPYLDHAGLDKVLLEPFQQRVTQLFVGYLAAAEVNGRLYFIPLLQYSGRMVLLEIIIVFVGARPELDLFYSDDCLFGLGLFRFLLLLVLPLPKIDNAAYGRIGLRSNFHQVEPLAAGEFNPALRRHYS